MSNPVWPPLDGSLSIVPGLVDFNEKHNPDRPWVVFPSTSSPGSIGSLTFADFAKATHKVAHAYRPGREGPEGEPVGVLINCDTIHYVAVEAGLIRAGLVPVLISHRNSAEAVANLLEKTSSHRLVAQDSTFPLANAAKKLLSAKNFNVAIEDLIPLHTLFPSLSPIQANGAAKDPEPYPPAPRPWRKDDVVYILHSSGSTGLPKPIPQTQEILRQWATCSYNVEGRNRMIRWAAMLLPPFHAMGILWLLTIPLIHGDAVALFTPQAPNPPLVPNPENVLEATRATQCDGLVTVPSMLEIWGQSPENVRYLATLRVVGYGGGALSQASGNKLMAAGVKLNVIYGSTEAGSSIVGFDLDDSKGPDAPWRTSADWEYCKFADYTKPRWIPQGDGKYELHLLTHEHHQPAVENLPDTKGYNTSDLWEPHPKKPGYWRIVGRTDDVIVLSSGEKIVPIAQENHMVSSPLVKGAVMFGRTRLQPGLLLEPSPGNEIDPKDEVQLARFRNMVWPAVEEANHLGPAFARVFKETILVASPDKPLPRAGKGTVQRKMALDLYAHEIDKLYETVENSTNANGIPPPRSWRSEDVEDWLLDHATSLNDGVPPPADADIFTHGFDSLNATLLRNRIIGALRASQEHAAQQAATQVSQNFIFDYPKIVEMAQMIARLVDPTTNGIVEKDRAEHISELIEKYSVDLPKPRGRSQRKPDVLAVLVTGSTGNLGSHVVASLLENERVAKVYTLDRANSGTTPLQRLDAAFKDRGLPRSLLSNGKLTTLTGDLDVPSFGLSEAMFHELQRTLTHAIHNAWKVNFNHALGSFESQISGTRKLLDFCAAAEHPVKLLFTSSISAAHRWSPADGPVPEAPLPDPGLATTTGYAASKYVVEQILDRAAQNGMETTSLRIGQLCGAEGTGAWNTTDWVPMLVKSSVAVGALPSLAQDVDWIAMDTVADAMTELVLAPTRAPGLLNVVHPRPVPWNDVLGAINDALGAHLPLVPYAQWLAKLEAVAAFASSAQLEAMPAIKILDFFRELGHGPSVVFATDKLQKASETVRGLRPIGAEHARAWVAYWRGKGYLV